MLRNAGNLRRNCHPGETLGEGRLSVSLVMFSVAFLLAGIRSVSPLQEGVFQNAMACVMVMNAIQK